MTASGTLCGWWSMATDTSSAIAAATSRMAATGVQRPPLHERGSMRTEARERWQGRTLSDRSSSRRARCRGGDPDVAGIVRASSSPVTHKKGTTPVVIVYDVPADSLTRKMIDGQKKSILETTALAFDSNGNLIGHNGLRFTLVLNEAKLRLTPHAPVELRQQIDLQKGDAYLVLGLQDMGSGAGGMLELPVQVPAPAKIAH